MNNTASTSNHLQLFAFNDERIRVTVDTEGRPWFVVPDVCRVLSIGNASMVLERLDRDDLSQIEVIDSMGRKQTANAVNEPGLYDLVVRSDKPEAKAFKRWITHEVIPSIRKSGGYAVAAASLPTNYLEALKALVVAEEAKEALQLENAALKPKAEFFDAVTASEDTLAMNETAKLLGVGRNKLMANLRKWNVLRLNNTPYQEFMDAGYFKLVETKWTDPDGGNHVHITTRVFQRGVEFIRRKLSKQPSN